MAFATTQNAISHDRWHRHRENPRTVTTRSTWLVADGLTERGVYPSGVGNTASVFAIKALSSTNTTLTFRDGAGGAIIWKMNLSAGVERVDTFGGGAPLFNAAVVAGGIHVTPSVAGDIELDISGTLIPS